MLNQTKTWLFFAIVYTIVLTVLSLITVSGIPQLGTDYDDKLYHVLAYALLTYLWYRAARGVKTGNPALLVAGLCTIYGIIIEVIQGKLTTQRVSDVLDIVANCVGVLLVLIYMIYKQKGFVKKN